MFVILSKWQKPYSLLLKMLNIANRVQYIK